MTDQERKQIFSSNLNKFLTINNKAQIDVATAIGVSQQTFNTWCRGVAIPRMGKIQLLADYFKIDMSELITRPDPAAVLDPVDAQMKRLEVLYYSLNDEGRSRLLEQAEFFASQDRYKSHQTTTETG